MCLITSGWIRPRNVPCSRSGTFGWRLVKAAHVRLVDESLIEGETQVAVLAPREGGVDDAGARHERRAVALVIAGVVARLHGVPKHGRVPFEATLDRLGVGVEHQLVGVEAMAGARLVGPVHAVGIDRAGPRVGEVAVPHLVGEFRQFYALDLAVAEMIEEAEFYLRRVGRK